jgi:hypothetical protein
VRRAGCHAFSIIKKYETLVLESFGSVHSLAELSAVCTHGSDKFSTKLLPKYRSIYCRIELNKTPDVFAANFRRDHRKSKFGLRHDIRLN